MRRSRWGSTLRRRVVPALFALGGGSAAAQTIPGAVLARSEPHHHLAFEDSTLRVLRVGLPAHDTTLLHEHGPDYFWIALGASEVVNARLGQPDATIRSDDRSIHYTVGRFAHVARNPGSSAFNNITVELLVPQTGAANLCDVAVSGASLLCLSAVGMRDVGVTERPSFRTDRLQVSLLTIAPGAAMTGEMRHGRSWFIALSAAEATSLLRIGGAANGASRGSALGGWVGGVWRAPQGQAWKVRNAGTREVQVLEVAPRP